MELIKGLIYGAFILHLVLIVRGTINQDQPQQQLQQEQNDQTEPQQQGKEGINKKSMNLTEI